MSSAPAKQRRNRKATEGAILEAFAKVVTREGLAAANPTSVMIEAGYSKPLLYDYFGGMEGLVKAWLDANRIWPDYDFPDSIDSADELKSCLKRFLLTTAEALRQNPVALEFLAAELNSNWKYQAMLDASRNDWLQENMAAVMAHPEIRDEDNWNLLFVVYNSINYLVLRSKSGTPHVGFNLDQDDDWQDAMRRTEKVIDDLIMLSKFKQTINK